MTGSIRIFRPKTKKWPTVVVCQYRTLLAILHVRCNEHAWSSCACICKSAFLFVCTWLKYTAYMTKAKPHLLYINKLRCNHIHHTLRHHPGLRRYDALPADKTQRLPLHHPQRNPTPHQRVEYHFYCQLQNEMKAGYAKQISRFMLGRIDRMLIPIVIVGEGSISTTEYQHHWHTCAFAEKYFFKSHMTQKTASLHIRFVFPLCHNSLDWPTQTSALFAKCVPTVYSTRAASATFLSRQLSYPRSSGMFPPQK